MSEVRARDAAIRRELGVPPTFDLVAHVRNLGRVLLPALVLGLLVSGALYMVRGSATPVYESNIVAEVQAGSQVVITDANLGQLVAPYVALATDNAVVADIQAQMGDAWSGVPVSAFMAVTPGTTPSLLFVKATGYSQLEADKLGRVIVKALDDAQSKRNAETLVRRTKTLNDEVARLNTELSDARQESIDNYETPVEDTAVRADLDAKLEQLKQMTTDAGSGDRLELLSAPAGSGLPVAPKPFVESAVAFLAVTILAAEILAACRGRFGTRMTDAWARRAAKKFGTSLLLQHSPTAEMPSNVALTVTQRASLGSHVLVLFGEGVAMDSWVVPEGLRSRISQRSLSSDWWSTVDSNAVDFALVVVSVLDADQKDVTDCLRALAEVDVTRSLILVGPAVSESLIASVRSRLGGTGSVGAAPRPRAEGHADSSKKGEGSGQPDTSGAARAAEPLGPPPAQVELDGLNERAKLSRAARAPSPASLDSMDGKMRDIRSRDVGNPEPWNEAAPVGSDRRRPHTVDGQAWRRNPADGDGAANLGAGVVSSSESFEMIDRRARRDLIDSATVTIDRNRLPGAEDNGKPDAAKNDDDSRNVEKDDSDGRGVDVADGDDINSEMRTERIMLTTRDISAARERRTASRVNLARTEPNANTSKN
ncbi:hypothetical protein [Rhodococcus sp. IEGM 1318]|uniref:hypothetical protein n=1 Tax=Rhodococcus sp. IEGM 1318 TaxID=3082226 RepID=UPI002955D336|nr:hypothetical protein [Rhodococcus sp. IEGM 1318]MDV8006337.1 hypothetical protein [Rhodococcus sp. IEGM 1318]